MRRVSMAEAPVARSVLATWTLGLTALGLLAAAGCGRAAASGPRPDEVLAEKIRASKSGGEAAAEGGTQQAVASADTWGTLTGVFRVDGSVPPAAKLTITKNPEVCGKTALYDESLVVGSDGGIANVLIYVSSKNVPVHPSYDDASAASMLFDNKNCRFEPHILPIRLSQTLDVHNADDVGHNSNMTPRGDASFNPNIAPLQNATYRFKKSQIEPVAVTCNIHPWMKGYVFPRENPYAAVTAADGTFKLENVPAGEWQFTVWHEKKGFLIAKPEWKRGRFKLAIQEGANDLGTIMVPASLLQ